LTKERVIPLEGELNDDTGRDLYGQIQGWTRDEPVLVILDLEKVNHIDNLGGAWLLRIRQLAQKRKGRLELKNPTGSVAEYLRFIGPGLDHMDTPPPHRPGFFENLGETFYLAKAEAGEAIRLLVDSLYWTFIAPLDGHGVRWETVTDEIHEIGVRALWIVALINYLLGFIVAMLAAAQVRKFGAGIYVADLVSIGFARELAPIMTAIIVSARSGAAISAEISTMKVQEEIDALKGMGLNVTQFLVAPKIIAMLAAMPCLAMIGFGAGIWGGLHVGIFILGLDAGQWMQETISAIELSDMAQGLVKSFVFAVLIVLVGCHNGFRVTGGSRGVGLMTTRAVVMDIFFIIALDVIFATLFYYTF